MIALRNTLSAFALSWIAMQPVLAINGPNGNSINIPGTPASAVGTTTLLTPPSNMTIKHITIGHGIQNFTCASPSATPVAIGALANLYDVTSFALANETGLAEIPPIAAFQPVDLASNSSLVIAGYGTFPRIGNHFFTSAGVPTFAFPTLNELLSGKSLASINAPAGSNPGPAGTGATTWLDLGDKGGSIGLSGVYRVLTAGGLPFKTCEGQNSTISVPYAASYWFLDLTDTSNTLAAGAASPSTSASPTVHTNMAPSFHAANIFVVVLVTLGLNVWLM